MARRLRRLAPRVHHLRVRGRNFSNRSLREIITPCVTIYRAGSTTPLEEITHATKVIEINSIEACKCSANKFDMKKKFTEAEVRTPQYFIVEDDMTEEAFKALLHEKLNEWEGSIIAKRYNSSKGNGLYLIENNNDNIQAFIDTLARKRDSYKNFLYERFSTYTREYRLHITKEGCFYACRKMLKQDAEVRWHRHDTNSVWITEENELFDKPANWDSIVADCVKALEAVGLDIGAFDVKVQRCRGENPKWLILEVNSAPGLGEIGLEKYKEQLKIIIEQKFQDLENNG